jgi:signal transduction histidine kinase/ligand-binding sensor domain-containing protein
VGSDDGLYQIIEDNGFRFKHHKHDKNNPSSLSGNFINCLYAGKDDRVWAGTWQDGLNEICSENDTLKINRYTHDQENEFSISAQRINAVLEDHSGNIWVGTSAGLDQIATKVQKFTTVYPSSHQLSSGIVRSILRDSKGNLWVGTLKGLTFLSAQDYEKKNYHFQQWNEEPLKGEDIRSLYEDCHGILWIATNQGLYYFELDNLKDKSIHQVSLGHFSYKDGLPHRMINSILQIDDHHYYIATFGQLSKMYFDINHLDQTLFTNYDQDETRSDALTNSLTYVIEKDKNGDYWIGTFNGLSKLVSDDDIGHFQNFRRNDSIPNSISDNSITDIHLAQDGTLWVGTRLGLNKVIQNGDAISFQSFGVEDGLVNDVIQSIEEDLSGKLWLGTNRGLIHFDPQLAGTKEAIIATYTMQDGLTGTFMVRRSTHIDKEGTLFFGSAQGLNIFNPDGLVQNEQAPEMVITNLKVNNTSIHPSDTSNAILDQAVFLTENIKLAYWENKLDIEFAALDFTKSEKNQYRYRLEGFDEDWIDNQTLNYARYSNIPPGKYTFYVKGSNNDFVWSKTPAQLQIHILPPPWKTWWAYLFYAIVSLSLIYRFYQIRVNKKLETFKEKARIEKARFEEREHLRKQNAADFHDELGHRLTKISLFLELAERSVADQEAVNKHLQKVKQNASGLSAGIRDLIWTLNPEQDSLFQTLIRIQEFGDQLYDDTVIDFQFRGIHSAYDTIFLDPHLRKHLLLIFKEAMNNALKYSEATQVEFCVKQEKENIHFQLRDNGKGFEEEVVKKGNGLQNMRERAEKINALFTLESSNKGTNVIVEIKIPHMGES